MPRVLLAEDHAALAELIAEGLGAAGFAVDVVGDGVSALARADAGEYDAVILDWMLPRVDGLAVLRRLRGDGHDQPILLLTARDAVEDRVRGLDAGADDYIVKPFALDELLARLRMLLRRRRGGAERVIEVDDLVVDTGARTARRGGREIPLSSREYAVLERLALSRGRIVSREQLVDHAYAGEEAPESNVIEVFIGHLRRKIDRDAATRLLHTRRGRGYLLGVAE